MSPRRILQRQVERAAALGYTFKFASELEFFLFRESLDEAAAKGYTNLTPHSQVIEDYHILQTTRDEYLIRAIRNGVDGAGIPVEFSKGEAGAGQHEINLVYADAVEMADRHVDLQERRPRRSRRSYGRAITFMAKYSDGRGRLVVPHPLERVGRRRSATALMWDADAPDHLSTVFRGWLGGQIACGRELAWMYAPTVNSYKRYQPESWAPTALAWSVDNRTCGFRIVGHGASFRLESRIPGADVNPYLAFAATIAAGLHGIEHGLDPPPALRRQRVRRHRASPRPVEHRRGDRRVRAVEGRGRRVRRRRARPLLNTARQEWLAFNRVGHRLGTAPELRPVVSRWRCRSSRSRGAASGSRAVAVHRRRRASTRLSRRRRPRGWATGRGGSVRRSRRRCSIGSTRSC